MPNKIQEELKKIAQEIIATEGSVDFEKTYHQTLSLFEKLVVLKNAQVVEKDTWKDMESNYNQAIDFIEVKKEPGTPPVGNNGLNSSFNGDHKRNCY